MKFVVALLATLAVCSARLVPRNTRDSNVAAELQDFLKLVNVDAIKELAIEYFSEDEEVQEAFFYLGSDEFRDLALTFEAMQEVKDLYAFLDKSGLDVYTLIDKVHEILNLPPFEHFAARRITGGLAGLVADFKALLPLEELEKLYNEKMANSKVFQEFAKQLKAQNFQAIADNILVHPEAKNIIAKLKSKGVDLKEIIDLVGAILGIKIPIDVRRAQVYESSNELEDILMEFVQMVPLDQVLEIYQQFYSNDREFRRTISFVQSEESKQTYLRLEGTDEFKQYTIFLNGIGLPIFKYLEEFHKLAEMPPYQVPTNFAIPHNPATSGFSGFVIDVSKALPVKEMKELFADKVQNSKRFRAFVDAIKSTESLDYVAAIVSAEAFNDALAVYEQQGLDILATFEFIAQLFGFDV